MADFPKMEIPVSKAEVADLLFLAGSEQWERSMKPFLRRLWLAKATKALDPKLSHDEKQVICGEARQIEALASLHDRLT